MLDPEAPDERRDQIASDARSRIEGSGSLKAEKTWGVRKLAYEIQRRNEADYRFYRFETEAPLLDELNHNLKITDGVLRFRIFKVDPDSPVIEPGPVVSLASSASSRPGGRRGSGGRGRDGYEDRGERSTPTPTPAPAAAPAAAEASTPAPEAAPAEAATPAPEAAPAEAAPAADDAPAAEPAAPAEQPAADAAAPEAAPQPAAPAE